MEPGEHILYRDRCSSASHPRWNSLVGGEVLVTSRRLLFCPTMLARLIGRTSWEVALGKIHQTHAEPVHIGPPFGALPSLRLVVSGGSAVYPIIVMKTDDRVTELATWINWAQWRL